MMNAKEAKRLSLLMKRYGKSSQFPDDNVEGWLESWIVDAIEDGDTNLSLYITPEQLKLVNKILKPKKFTTIVKEKVKVNVENLEQGYLLVEVSW